MNTPFDFDDYAANHFLAVRQLEIKGPIYQRRPDVIGFVNGLPLVFFELKAHHKDLRDAYEDNLRDYKDTIPHVFDHNAFIVLSNGLDARVGTLTSPYRYFLTWKRFREGEEGSVSLDTVLRGTCAPTQLMDLFENFLLYDRSGGDIVKLMARNHQYLGVNRVIDNVRDIEDLHGKLGVFWHTQGSGKSYSMVFLCEKIHRKLGGPTPFYSWSIAPNSRTNSTTRSRVWVPCATSRLWPGRRPVCPDATTYANYSATTTATSSR